MRARPIDMFLAMLLAAWLGTAGSCSSSPSGTDAASVTTGVAGKGSGGASGTGGAAGRGSGGTAGAGCGALCQPGQTCCYDRTGKVQCLPAGAVCTG